MPDYYNTFFRNYDQALGRFVGLDPLAEAAESLTGYNYSGNNPVMFNDPLGDDKRQIHPTAPDEGGSGGGMNVINLGLLQGKEGNAAWQWIHNLPDPQQAQQSAANIGGIFSQLWGTKHGGWWDSSDPSVIKIYDDQQAALRYGTYAAAKSGNWSDEYTAYRYSSAAAEMNSSATAGYTGYSHVVSTLNEADRIYGLLLNEVEIHNSRIGHGILGTNNRGAAFGGGNELMAGYNALQSGAKSQLYFVFAEIAGPFIGAVKWLPNIGKLFRFGRAAKVATYTKSSLRLGQQVHRAYKAALHNPAKGMFKEFVLPSGKRIDFLDITKGIIYELKPNNPRAIKQGLKQLDMYMRELMSMPEFEGINWKTVLDKY